MDGGKKKRHKFPRNVNAINLLNKLTPSFYVSVLLLMIKWRHNIVKVGCGSWIHNNFDNVVASFYHQREDRQKTGVNLFFYSNQSSKKSNLPVEMKKNTTKFMTFSN